jgi:WD repeat-containing protein 45
VILQNKVYVYNFADLKLLMDIETSPNPLGLAGLSPATDKIVLAVPGATKGEIRVEKQVSTSNDPKAALPAAASNAQFIVACQSQVSQIAVDIRGSRIASASEKGTIIRVFDSNTGQALDQFRRGSSQANVQCIAFNHDATIIAVTSDKGTLHFFTVGGENKGSRFKSLLPSAIAGDYFESKWSFTQITVPEQHSICGFVQDATNTLIVLGASGTYYRISLTPDPSTKQLVAKEEARASFLKADQAV